MATAAFLIACFGFFTACQALPHVLAVPAPNPPVLAPSQPVTPPIVPAVMQPPNEPLPQQNLTCNGTTVANATANKLTKRSCCCCCKPCCCCCCPCKCCSCCNPCCCNCCGECTCIKWAPCCCCPCCCGCTGYGRRRMMKLKRSAENALRKATASECNWKKN